MEGPGPQRGPPLARDLTRAFGGYNKHSVLLRKNLKETHAFFREMRQNYSNTCASSTWSSDSASLETSKSARRPASGHLCLPSPLGVTQLTRCATEQTAAVENIV